MRFGVDFGTSNTVGVLQRPDGTVTPLLFDSSPLLTSAVFAGADPTLLTGADAERAALAYPAGLEPNPKRRIDDGTTWLGEREFAVVDLIAAVLVREWGEALRVTGGVPPAPVLTHPAAWGHTRLGLLAEAVRRAGLPPAAYVPEPVAAAAYFATILGREVPPGRALVVYDLGAGTFDVSVVRRSPGGFEVMASGGLPDVGGLDLDAVIVGHARTLTARATDAWGRLDWPESGADQRARRELWQGARAAKELLSRHSHADLYVPLVDTGLHITREEFEKAARPHLDRTVATTLAVLRSAGIARETTAGLFLVGGSSRIPLVATLLHRQLGVAPTVIDAPELVVAHGSLAAAVRPPAPPLPPVAAPPVAPYAPVLPVSPAPPFAPPAARPVVAPARPMPAVQGIPPKGVLPEDFPIHLVEIALGEEVGYTLRTYIADEDGQTPAVFPVLDGRLALYRRPERATEYAAGTEGHAMTSVLHWEVLSHQMANAYVRLSKDHRYDLDLPGINLTRDPRYWLISTIVKAGELAWELIEALRIEEGYALFGRDTVLDAFDDALRAHLDRPLRLGGRRDLHGYSPVERAGEWQRLAEVIQARIDWRD